MTDAEIERLLIEAGHTPGPVSPSTMRRYSELLISECVQACRDIEARYPVPLGYERVLSEYKPDRASRITAQNCARAIEARLGEQ